MSAAGLFTNKLKNMGKTIGIIGCGNMGGAILKGLAEAETFAAAGIFITDKDREKAEKLAKVYRCTSVSLEGLLDSAGYLVIAVKPQDSGQLLGEIGGKAAGKVVVSIMAGVTIKSIETFLKDKDIAVVRAMPNLGAMTGNSMTCIADNGIAYEKNVVEEIFLSIGKVSRVDESLMDAVTAVAGSGPAYLFFLAGAMIQAAVDNGFTREAAEDIVMHTIKGAVSYMSASGDSPETLIDKVASKGGTTEAALSVLKERKIYEGIIHAIKMARKRSEELSRG